ncbi:MAG: UbiD family decarboxylase [Desulfobacterales bacterium]|nr:UbiD family decarboxylase [Desulfobacterales bacterium]
MDYKDLREWLQIVSGFDELKVVKGADWNLEIGSLHELNHKENMSKGKLVPALLFDEIKGYPPGFRVLTNSLSSVNRLGLTLNLDLAGAGNDQQGLIEMVRKKMAAPSPGPVPPKVVQTGPVMENIDEGSAIDLTKFPVPFWHEDDCGRYIGTGSVTITRDPDDGWINLGTYRVMMHDEKSMGFYISPGKHGRIQREKYFSANKPCPVTVVIGGDPLHLILASKEMDYGTSEYDIAGEYKGFPVEVIEGVNGLPFPADAELVIEGESIPGDTKPEGPFGEWTGYYGSGMREEPVIRVKRVLYRNDPIILAAPPCKPPTMNSFFAGIFRSAMLRNDLEKNSIPDVRAVGCHEIGGSRLFVVISIKQRYPGHVKQVAMSAAQCHSTGYLGRFIVVVDEDIDPTNLHDVMWAVCTRCDPERDIDIVRNCWSGPLDPIIPPERKGFSSRALIDACRPYDRLATFPKVAQVSPALRTAMLNKWPELF